MQYSAPAQPPTVGEPDLTHAPSRIGSADLLRGHRTIEIEHGKQRYTLRVTKDDKLILTK